MRRSSGARPVTTWTWQPSRANLPGYARHAGRYAVLWHLSRREPSQQTSGSGAGWSDAGVIIPWTSWLQTGDTSIIEQNWAAMEKYLDAIDAANPGWTLEHESGTPFGDWLSPEGKTDYTLIATAYWAYDVTLMRADGPCHGPRAGRGEVRAALREDSRRISEAVCARRRLCGRRGQQRAVLWRNQQSRTPRAKAAIRRPATCWRCT